MYQVANEDANNRRELFNGTARKMGASETIVKTDFVRFNEKFYRSSWARYEDATPEKIRLVPSDETIARLADDYGNMQEMLFGLKPSFDVIMQGLRTLESEMHQLDAK